jgi:hypothetical protein
MIIGFHHLDPSRCTERERTEREREGEREGESNPPSPPRPATRAAFSFIKRMVSRRQSRRPNNPATQQPLTVPHKCNVVCATTTACGAYNGTVYNASCDCIGVRRTLLGGS